MTASQKETDSKDADREAAAKCAANGRRYKGDGTVRR
jgi:hypothetical protein